MDINIVKTVSILIIFVLTSFTILLLHIGRHTKSNMFLAAYFISQIAVEFCYLITPGGMLFLLLTSFCFSWGQLYYLFVVSLIIPEFKFRAKTLFHFIPSLLAFIFLVGKHFNVFENYNDHLFTCIQKSTDNLLNILFNILILGYSIAAIFMYIIHFSKIKTLSSSKRWINFAVFGFLISSFIARMINFMHIQSDHKFLFGNFIFLIFFCILFYIAIVFRTITDKLSTIEKYKNSTLNSSVSNEILERLEFYMKQKAAYLNPELSLKNLSTALNIQEKYISEVINKLKGMNFSEYINFYRISYAMNLLKDPENKDKTMLYILFESGFNSKTTFNIRFKQVVGCTPLEYKNSLKN